MIFQTPQFSSVRALKWPNYKQFDSFLLWGFFKFIATKEPNSVNFMIYFLGTRAGCMVFIMGGGKPNIFRGANCPPPQISTLIFYCTFITKFFKFFSIFLNIGTKNYFYVYPTDCSKSKIFYKNSFL